MSWLKDNLIMVLGGLAAVLALGWGIDHLWATARYAKLETDFVHADLDRRQLAEANKSNQQTITSLKATNELWASTNAANVNAAKIAAGRADALKGDLARTTDDNRRLRARLAQENPDVAAYLDDGMPRELACQLWPDAGYCQN